MTLEIISPEGCPGINQAVVRLEEAGSGQASVKRSPNALSMLRSRAGMELRQMKGAAGKEEEQKGHKTWPHSALAASIPPNP